MDSLGQARTKVTTMLVGLSTIAVCLAAGSTFAAMAQQPAQSIRENTGENAGHVHRKDPDQ